jgi:hypothetical protein
MSSIPSELHPSYASVYLTFSQPRPMQAPGRRIRMNPAFACSGERSNPLGSRTRSVFICRTRVRLNFETFCHRAYPSILTMLCSIPLRRGEAPQSVLLLIIRPCIHYPFKPHRLRILSHKQRHRHKPNRNHKCHRHRPRLKHNLLPGRSARHQAMFSVSYRSKRTCDGYFKSVVLRMATRSYSPKPLRLPLRRTYERKTSSRFAPISFLLARQLITFPQEWYSKCITSQVLIAAQIPWATVGADRSRTAREAQQQQQQQQRTAKRPNGQSVLSKSHRNKQGSGEESPVELTPEEQLLGALLEANEALTSVLRVYEDIERIGIEREAMERSRQETRLDRSVSHLPSRIITVT